MLYIGDSIGHTANLRLVEKASNCRVVSASAYSSVQDARARWPGQNFKNVVEDKLKNPSNEEYDVLVMSSPTVDISNLDTNLHPNSTTENLEEKAINSSKNMFNTAEEALNNNANLKRVIIMEHPPRFDDPLKSKLAELANTTLNQLWSISTLNSKICIGRHSLVGYGSGSTHLARYKDYNTGRYDGVHLYGRTGVKDYTDSVKSMLVIAMKVQHPNNISGDKYSNTLGDDDHTTCEQAVYQWRQVQRRRQDSAAQYRYTHTPLHGQSPGSVHTSNRFAFFNQEN